MGITINGNGRVGLVGQVSEHEKKFEQTERNQKALRNHLYIAVLLLAPFLTVLFNQLLSIWRHIP
jgi:hypothetical protein